MLNLLTAAHIQDLGVKMSFVPYTDVIGLPRATVTPLPKAWVADLLTQVEMQ